MKKIVSLALAMLMLAFVLTGCAKAKDAAEEAVSDAIAASEGTDAAASDSAAQNDTQQSAPSGG